MTVRLTDRDWETLSAYLDSALQPNDRSRVEERLGKDTEFKAAYVSLLKTRGILRSVPQVKRRRSFVLTPELVKPKEWGWLLPAMNYSSLAAGILAFFFLIIDLLPITRTGMVFQAAKESVKPQMSAPKPMAAAPATSYASPQPSQPPAVEMNMAADKLQPEEQAAGMGAPAQELSGAANTGSIAAPPKEQEQVLESDVPQVDEVAPSMKLENAAPEPVPLEPIPTLAFTEGTRSSSGEESKSVGEIAAVSPTPLPTLSSKEWAVQPTVTEPGITVKAAIPTSTSEFDRSKGAETLLPNAEQSEPGVALIEAPPSAQSVVENHSQSFAPLGGLLLLLALLLGLGSFILGRRSR